MSNLVMYRISNDISAIYSPETLGVAYFNQNATDIIKAVSSARTNCFQDNTYEAKLWNELFKNKTIFNYKKRPLRTLYFCTSYDCNLSCSYCLTKHSISVGRSSTRMSDETAQIAIDYFFRNSTPNSEREIVLYGGEPALYPELIQFIYHTVRYYEKKEEYKSLKPCRFILCTNGVLLSDELIAFIKAADIYTCVSIDGDKDIHDMYRPTNNGKGSFDAAKKGYMSLKNNGLKAGISMTLGTHLSEQLPDLIRKIHDEFAPNTLATNTLVDYENEDSNYWIPGSRELSVILWDAFMVSRDVGVYLVKNVMDNRIKPFVEKQPRFWGCTGMGARVGVLPDGKIVPCMALTQNFAIDVRDNPELERLYPTFLSNGSPYQRIECAACPAKATCGGGCPASSYLKGQTHVKDNSYCEASKFFLRSMIKLLWELCKEESEEKMKNHGVFIPTEANRKKIYGNIKVDGKALDYQYTPNA